jgi:TP53 regulating kinase-like protein
MFYQGAEAKICISKYMGFDVIEKRRISKSYRIKEIDGQLISCRTREEAKLISEVRKYGVSVPIIFDVDQENGIITMEYLKGKRIKDIFNNISDEKRADICKEIGISIGRLHKNNVIHGDITTSNMIYQDGKIHFIDFGLGEINSEIEAKGVDLHVLMEAIESAHSKFSNFYKYVLDGYKSEYMKDAGPVIKKIREIVKRGRYR